MPRRQRSLRQNAALAEPPRKSVMRTLFLTPAWFHEATPLVLLDWSNVLPGSFPLRGHARRRVNMPRPFVERQRHSGRLLLFHRDTNSIARLAALSVDYKEKDHYT